MDYYVPWGITNPDALEALTVIVSDSHQISSQVYRQALEAKLEVLLERNSEGKSQIPDWVTTVHETDLKTEDNENLASMIVEADEWASLLNSLEKGLQPRRMTPANHQLYQNRYNQASLLGLLELLG